MNTLSRSPPHPSEDMYATVNSRQTNPNIAYLSYVDAMEGGLSEGFGKTGSAKLTATMNLHLVKSVGKVPSHLKRWFCM